MAISKNIYTEYSEALNVNGQEIEVIIQIPESSDIPAKVITKTGARHQIFNLDEWFAINRIVLQALGESGYTVE